MKQIYRLVHIQARQRAAQAVQAAPDGFVVTVAEPTRTQSAGATPYMPAPVPSWCLTGF